LERTGLFEELREKNVLQTIAAEKSPGVKMPPFPSFVAAAMALAAIVSPANAITAKNVLEKMTVTVQRA
jgi:hypothetical protein